jgi:energy-coupling factor transporter ATP-binding protein EcfA2
MGLGSTYDVFFSYSGVDKAEVELLATRLQREAGLQPFLDKWHLVPGEPWQPELERAIEQSSTAAIFFGPQGRGAWHIEEVQVLLDKAARSRNDFRVVPVLLPGASADTLDAFLKQRTWVDFRSGLDDLSAFKRLVAGIKGEAIEPNGYELPDEPAPYRGLERFEARQKDFFFGREDDIRRLARRLSRSRFVAIVGASGCGKSSLARAGLHTVIASQELPAIRDWRLVIFLPGGNPLRALAEQIAAEAPVADRVRVADELTERFEAREDGLCTAIGALTGGSQRVVLIVVDQFEEIFTHSGITRDSASTNSSRAEQLIANLLNAVEDPSGSIRVLITLRADFVPHSLEFPQLRYLLENNQLLLGELGPEALREAIKFPARKVGAFFEKGLVELILRDVHQQRGSLPLLQHALKELWQARLGPWLTLEAYERSGGVAGALRRRAQDTYEQKLKDEQQRAIARSILLRLITLGEGVRDSRRRVPREELFPHVVERRQVEQVLSVLSHNETRLIVVNDDNTVEVTHEALQLPCQLRENREPERHGLGRPPRWFPFGPNGRNFSPVRQ